MSEPISEIENGDVEEVVDSPLPPRRPLRSLGCYSAVLLWFMLLLTPCLCMVLATQGQITVDLGGAPEQMLRIWLVNEATKRGVAISRPTVYGDAQANAICVQTDVNFLLWVGQEAPSSYCNCYTRPDGQSAWAESQTASGQCPSSR
jgi:hypothetical protein